MALWSGIASLPAAVRSAVKRTDNGLPAVKWLSVPQLARTAADVMHASMFARYADKREAMASSPREFYRLAPAGSARHTVWVDYVADTGDGFNATFAMACCVAGAPGVQIAAGRDGGDLATFDGRPAQADLLVLGGDEVYPVASAAAYEARLNSVLRMAARLAGMQHGPPVVALPGNHDWYDGLAAFRRNFCESWVLRGRPVVMPSPEAMEVPAAPERDDVGGWGAFQSRSYFAVQLTPSWWLWAVDSQLDAPIDAEQLSYFRDARTLLGEADVILCTATPSWLAAAGDRVHAAAPDTPLYTLLWFVDRVLGAEHRDRIRLLLTGDEHHYARYSPSGGETVFGPELVTCGGGGAFLASTHHLDDNLRPAWQPWPDGSGDSTRYRLTTSYPTPDESRKLVATPRFLAAGWRNGWTLPLLIGVIDFLVFLTLVSQQWSWAFTATLAVGVLLCLYAARGAKGRPPGWRRRAAVGILTFWHTAAHVGAAALAVGLARGVSPAAVAWYGHLSAFALLVVLGATVFVTYIHVADRFDYHALEAFSGMRFERYNCHLRLEVADDRIRVHVVGIDTIASTRRAEDLAGRLPEPHLVDTFTVYPRPDAPPTT